MTRTLLTMAMVLVIIAIYALMRLGWQRRLANQQSIAIPSPLLQGQVLAGPWPGVFIGTTFAGRWLDRIDAHTLGARSNVTLTVLDSGINIEREGERSFGIPRDAVAAVRADKAIAGRAYEGAGLIVISFSLGEQEVECGIRIPSTSDHLAALTALTMEVAS